MVDGIFNGPTALTIGTMQTAPLQHQCVSKHACCCGSCTAQPYTLALALLVCAASQSLMRAVCSREKQYQSQDCNVLRFRRADFVNVVRRFKLLGFNAVRLPFSMAVQPSSLEI